jgi:sirohydrochlorin cobaltochelatase
MQAPQSAIVLFAHGARDPRWGISLQALASAIESRRPGAQVRIAYLEMQMPRLPAVLDEVAAGGAVHVDIVPVFWAGAGHVDNELPPMIREFNARSPGVRVRTLPVLSELPGLLDFVAGTLISLTPGPHPASGRG